jgi:hypothetical protein
MSSRIGVLCRNIKVYTERKCWVKAFLLSRGDGSRRWDSGKWVENHLLSHKPRASLWLLKWCIYCFSKNNYNIKRNLLDSPKDGACVLLAERGLDHCLAPPNHQQMCGFLQGLRERCQESTTRPASKPLVRPMWFTGSSIPPSQLKGVAVWESGVVVPGLAMASGIPEPRGTSLAF